MSGCSGPGPTPTLAGFQAFITTNMQIPTTVLPADSVYIGYAYEVAIAFVSHQLKVVSAISYTLAVYNLAANNLITYAEDLPDAPIFKDDLPFFAFQRKRFGISAFIGGVITGSGDNGTSQSLEVVESLKNLTLLDLNALNTPWGRTYLMFAGQIGSLWGAS
jgi:hypothetical protein